MIKEFDISNKKLKDIKENKLSDGSESDTYLYEINGQQKVIKIFKNDFCIENKIKKINFTIYKFKS